MTIIKTLRTKFSGITTMIASFIGAFRAYLEYVKALNAVEALKMMDPVNAWALNVSIHSMLSYKDARDIYDFLFEHPSICKYQRKVITEFVIELVNSGHTAHMIILYLKQIDMELDCGARGKLIMR